MKTIIFLCAITLSFCVGMAFQTAKSKPAASQRAHATGIGGIFFKSEDPAKLQQWYEKHLGIKLRAEAGPGEPPMFEWREKDKPDVIGITVWGAFPKTTKYFEPTRAPFMINYRVDNLERLLKQLREAGVKVDDKISDEFNGRFSWAIDPEGNRFELWEPK
jgi:predicted enzyme related to lactoylglutathione lyase